MPTPRRTVRVTPSNLLVACLALVGAVTFGLASPAGAILTQSEDSALQHDTVVLYNSGSDLDSDINTLTVGQTITSSEVSTLSSDESSLDATGHQINADVDNLVVGGTFTQAQDVALKSDMVCLYLGGGEYESDVNNDLTAGSTYTSSAYSTIRSDESTYNADVAQTYSDVNSLRYGMSPPSGYSTSSLIFDDGFTGTSLNTSNWNTYLGAQGGIWNNEGDFASPYSGPNSPANGGAGTDLEMYAPSQVAVNNGLTLTAVPNTSGSTASYAAPGSAPYNTPSTEPFATWLSGVVTTEGKFSLPTSSWYVQVKAKMPDQSQGMWPAIWFLPGVSGTPSNEFDGYEGGWLGADPNEVMHSDYFAPQGQQQEAYSLGEDVTAGYHIYGFQFIPGQSITAFFDGRQVWQVSASSGITISGEPYEIILQLEVASQQISGFHTVPTGSTPSATMDVAEVQAYS